MEIHIEKEETNSIMKSYQRIRDLREDRDLTQAQMAQLLHCSQQAYSNYELGQRDVPTDVLIQLALFYRVSTDYILGISDDPQPRFNAGLS